MPTSLSSLTASYDLQLLALAAVVCSVSSLAVFRLRSRMRYSRGLVRTAWIFLCGLEAAAGVWATPFIALLAFHPGVRTGIEPLTILGSVLIAAATTSAAFGVAWSGHDRLRTLAGALLLALAIAVTNYLDIFAYRAAARIDWNAIAVWTSVSAAIVLTAAAMLISGRARTWPKQLAGAVLLAAGVMALHMLSMQAVTLTPDAAVAVPPKLLNDHVLAVVVAVLATMMILGGLGAAHIDDASSREAVQRSRRLADAAREGIVVIDEAGMVLDCNSAFAGLMGAPMADLLKRPLLGAMLEPQTLALDGAHELMLHRDAGDAIPVEVFARPLIERTEDGRSATVVAVRDLREQRAAEQRIRHLAEHDGLTGLPNRSAFRRDLETLLTQAGETGESLSVFYLDLDHFKLVNDLHGQTAGDALLSEVSRRLTAAIASPSVVARQGGDEFVVAYLCPSEDSGARVAEIAAQLSELLREPFFLDELTLEPAATMGVSCYPHDGRDAEALLTNADIALHRAKEEGRGGFRFFKKEMDQALRQQRDMARDLRAGIPDGQLVVYYQPQARTETGEVCGFEALVRWRHPVHGMLGPDKFIPVAEANGLIGQLGGWVLRRACEDAATWPNPLGVAVNLSPLQLSQPGLPAQVHEVLIATGLSPRRLELEITESALFLDYQRALDNLRRLKALGVRIAMDDFGTGYSSLSTLHSFPFDKIKIDKSFVEGIGKLERSTVIVRAVLGIGKGLAIPVVAEGVETPEQMAFLRDESCAEVQGYHIGRPAPVETHAALVGLTSPEPPAPEVAVA